MATLNKHGSEIGRIDFITYSKAYMTDGTILKNGGQGWKIYGKIKQGFKPEQVYQNKLNKFNEINHNSPMLALYRKELHKLTNIKNRWFVHNAIELMPDDPDGVWATLNDDYFRQDVFSIEEIVNLCKLYNQAQLEHDLNKEKDI